MKHIFIINPTAGKTDSRQKIYDMAESLRQKHGLDVQCILTKKQGHATELAKKLCETGEALRFYACGGDGRHDCDPRGNRQRFPQELRR